MEVLMGVDLIFFDMMCQTARETSGGSACSAGYPDMLVREAVLAKALGADVVRKLPTRRDSSGIISWHGVNKMMDKIYDSHSVFAALGYELDVIDSHPVRGGEIILDLNHPLPAGFSRTYDLVLDTGTIEHCFNIGQSAVNLATLVKQGGFIVQGLPFNMFNHGFYNINPTWFHDFYPDNGFEIMFLQGATDWLTAPKLFDPPPFARFSEAPRNAGIYVVARRREVKPITFPIQRKYRTNPGLGT
jgi:hypothetical protein